MLSEQSSRLDVTSWILHCYSRAASRVVIDDKTQNAAVGWRAGGGGCAVANEDHK